MAVLASSPVGVSPGGNESVGPAALPPEAPGGILLPAGVLRLRCTTSAVWVTGGVAPPLFLPLFYLHSP